jgi:hypothetical protein
MPQLEAGPEDTAALVRIYEESVFRAVSFFEKGVTIPWIF